LLRPLTILLLSLQFLGFSPPSAGAQEAEPVRIQVQPGTGAARLELGSILSHRPLLEAIHSGLPLRIRVVVQLWREGFFHNQEGQHQWRAGVIFDPLTRRYHAQSLELPGEDVVVSTLDEVQALLARSLEVPLRPPRPGRYYYMVDVEMETLSLSDLEELQRWLQGDLAPAVAGEERVGGALARGVRRLLVRMLGLPAQRFQLKSPAFQVEAGSEPAQGGD
jgi:hypothetical protein